MPTKKTLLEELATERTRYTLGATAVRELDLLAERAANALFKDPIVRERLQALVGQHFGEAERRLFAGEPRPRRRAKRR